MKFSPQFFKEVTFNFYEISQKIMTLVSKPDKGNGVVIINKSYYIDSITKNNNIGHLKVEKILEPISKVILRTEDQINYFLEKMEKKLCHI